jgi:isopropylmalate/homocitrate/citramalate synthase
MVDRAKSETPWKVPGKWTVSQHGFDPEVRAGWQLPERIIIHDVTLRDGEQTPGVVFRKDEKLKIAHALEDAGIQRIEGGMAAVSTEDAEAIRAMAKEIKHAEIATFVRARQDDIELALKCNVQWIIMEIGARDDLIKNIWGSRGKAVEAVIKAVSYAKRNGLKVNFFLMDSATADLDLLRELIVPTVEEGKVDSVAVVDTWGSIYPSAFAWLVSQVKQMVKVPIEIHCHNKWGMGTATTLAGITAGAEVMHACVNGMGANASLEECVLGAEAFLGVETGIRTETFRALSAMVKEFSRADWYKPFVGSLTCQIEVGIATQWMWDKRHIPGMGRKDLLNYEIVGDKTYEVVLGKKSGKHSIMIKALEFNLPMPSEEQISEILAKVKALSEEHKRWLTDDEFKKIYSEVTGTSV